MIFLFNSIFGLNFNSFAASNNKKDGNEFNIGTDYLEKLPENDYIIGPGDNILIIVSRDYPELTSEVFIDGEGTIYLPKLNRVYVTGLSMNELKDILNEAFKKFVKYPDVELIITKYRPIRIMVQGEVENPGLQTLEGSVSVPSNSYLNTTFDSKQTNSEDSINSRNDNFESNSFYFPTIYDVIRKSGGITVYSDLSNVKLIRKNTISSGGDETVTEVNFLDVIAKGDSSKNLRVYDSDVIIIK